MAHRKARLLARIKKNEAKIKKAKEARDAEGQQPRVQILQQDPQKQARPNAQQAQQQKAPQQAQQAQQGQAQRQNPQPRQEERALVPAPKEQGRSAYRGGVFQGKHFSKTYQGVRQAREKEQARGPQNFPKIDTLRLSSDEEADPTRRGEDSQAEPRP